MKILVGILFFAACCFGASTFVKQKSDSIGDVLKIQERLRQMALKTAKTTDNAKIDQQIERLLDTTQNAQDLAKVALIGRIIAHPQNAEHASFDVVFERAFWVCAKTISAIGGKEARSAFEETEAKAGLMGHDKTLFNELRSRVK